jgi:hypothetical protein
MAMCAKFLTIGLLLLCGAAVPAHAKKLGPGDRVILSGCVQQGVPQFCRRLKGYNVTGGFPPLLVGQQVDLAGTISTDVGPCSGIPLTDIVYTGFPVFCQAHHH